MVEAVVIEVSADQKTFAAMVANSRNGRGPLKITCAIVAQQPIPRIGQAIVLNLHALLKVPYISSNT